ncbi:MAG: class I SAM-dependent RNA methyltransferase, partial [Proteobacteria bacterium]|nr:class I SAM-dependent RNA methyltransferase [Pseudomonadota bacterium]
MNIKIRDIIETRIDTVAFGGDGVGRVDNMVIFVPFTVDGDVVEVEITGVKKKYLRGKIKKIVVPSPQRAEPKCLHFSECGGCQYQHILYKYQLEMKRRQVVESFERIGRLGSPPVKEIIPSPEVFGYRGKAEYHIGFSEEKIPEIGFMDVEGGKLVDIERCEIVDETINRSFQDFRDDLIAGRTEIHDERKIIWSGLSGIEKTAGAPEYITRMVKGKSLIVPCGGFFQANIFLVDTLVDCVVEMSGLTGSEAVLDCYCGSGLFSLFLAGHARQVFGMEINGESAKCARMNHENFGISNATVFMGDIKGILGEKLSDIDLVILDPPRIGCDRDVLSGIVELKPERIIYISCNPATQARDIRYLIDEGFFLRTLQPMDMFPQTKHIEVIALMV